VKNRKEKESGIISRLPLACNACKNFGVDGKHFPSLKRIIKGLEFLEGE
jgi:hypothetical protein